MENLIRLSLKEKIKIIIDFSGSYFSSGFDLCLYFQNIDEKVLKGHTDKHGLHIHDEWEDNFWTQEN